MNKRDFVQSRSVGGLNVMLLTALSFILNTPTPAQTCTVLHNFAALPYGTNSDGANPVGLTLSGDILYGTTYRGGASGGGIVFKVNIDGTSFVSLHSFTAMSGSAYPGPNADGWQPEAGLVVSSNTLYGTARYGGTGSY